MKNMRFSYTKHVEAKLKALSTLGVKISKKAIENTVKSPLHVDIETDYPKIIASAEFDKHHILRVVYRIESDIIVVITCYPAQKGRYLK